MISPGDDDYQETKLFKLGKRALLPPFRELASWIEESHAAKVLNVRYDRPELLNRPRLSVIFEREESRIQFMDGANFKREKQAAVAEKFREIVAASPSLAFDTDHLLVIFQSFEPVARTEANWNIERSELDEIRSNLAHLSLWEIWPSWDSVTFFFQTDAELKSSAENGAQRSCRAAYGELMRPLDEFGYLRERPIEVRFNSKENLDRNYEGSLFLYDRA
jgi:hypothetical protein